MLRHTARDERTGPLLLMSGVSIRPLRPSDWPTVEAIFREGIHTGHATFESQPPQWHTFDDGRLPGHRWVAVDADATVLGWVAVTPTSSRPAYSGVVENSVYVSAAVRGRGIGHLLLQRLIESTEADGIWTIQSSIFPENTASLELHDANGFRRLGRRERIALMSHGPLAGQWRDTILVERRSTGV